MTRYYDGTLMDRKRNPVYAVLSTYGELSEEDILGNLQDWWSVESDSITGKELFDEAVNSGLISLVDDGDGDGREPPVYRITVFKAVENILGW